MHAYNNRYATTNVGPARVRTHDPITSAKARRIMTERCVRFPTGVVVNIEFQHWMSPRDMLGWLGVIEIDGDTAAASLETSRGA